MPYQDVVGKKIMYSFVLFLTIMVRKKVQKFVGGARAVDDQAECLDDQILGRWVLGWKVK